MFKFLVKNSQLERGLSRHKFTFSLSISLRALIWLKKISSNIFVGLKLVDCTFSRISDRIFDSSLGPNNSPNKCFPQVTQ